MYMWVYRHVYSLYSSSNKHCVSAYFRRYEIRISSHCFFVLQVNTPYATPMSEVQKGADSGSGGHEETDSPTIDHHYVYSLRDFQPFESTTYQGRLLILH